MKKNQLHPPHLCLAVFSSPDHSIEVFRNNSSCLSGCLLVFSSDGTIIYHVPFLVSSNTLPIYDKKGELYPMYDTNGFTYRQNNHFEKPLINIWQTGKVIILK